MDAPDTLLLSENVCCKLNIVSYHPDVLPVAEPSQKKLRKKGKKAKIKLIQTVRLPADSSAVVLVEVKELTSATLMLELDKTWHNRLVVNDCLLMTHNSGTAPIIVSNTSLSTQVLKKGTHLGRAATLNLIHAEYDVNTNIEESEGKWSAVETQTYSNGSISWWKQDQSLSAEEISMLYDIVEQCPDIFALDDGMRGETNLVEFNVITGESAPIKQVACIVPFAIRQKITAQLSKM